MKPCHASYLLFGRSIVFGRIGTISTAHSAKWKAIRSVISELPEARLYERAGSHSGDDLARKSKIRNSRFRRLFGACPSCPAAMNRFFIVEADATGCIR